MAGRRRRARSASVRVEMRARPAELSTRPACVPRWRRPARDERDARITTPRSTGAARARRDVLARAPAQEPRVERAEQPRTGRQVARAGSPRACPGARRLRSLRLALDPARALAAAGPPSWRGRGRGRARGAARQDGQFRERQVAVEASRSAAAGSQDRPDARCRRRFAVRSSEVPRRAHAPAQRSRAVRGQVDGEPRPRRCIAGGGEPCRSQSCRRVSGPSLDPSGAPDHRDGVIGGVRGDARPRPRFDRRVAVRERRRRSARRQLLVLRARDRRPGTASAVEPALTTQR